MCDTGRTHRKPVVQIRHRTRTSIVTQSTHLKPAFDERRLTIPSAPHSIAWYT